MNLTLGSINFTALSPFIFFWNILTLIVIILASLKYPKVFESMRNLETILKIGRETEVTGLNDLFVIFGA